MKDKLFELFETNGELHLETVALNIAMAAVLGFLIFVSYYITHRGTIYSKKFNASLDRKSTRLNSSHMSESRMPSSA